MLKVCQNGEEYQRDIGLVARYMASPSRIAKKNIVFRAFFNMGDRAMDKFVKLRDEYSAHYKQAMDLVKNDSDREHLFSILWAGDEMQKEFGELSEEELNKIKAANSKDESKAIQQARVEKICKKQKVSENVAKAYIAIRRQLNTVYTLLDEAQRRPRQHAQHLSDKQIENLRKNKFIDAASIKVSKTQDDDGKRLTRWTEFENHKRTETINQDVLDRYEADDAI